MADATTEILAITGVVPLFAAVNEGTLPLPLAGIPMDGLELVHVNVAPLIVLVNTAPGTVAPWQILVSEGTIASGEGFTVMI